MSLRSRGYLRCVVAKTQQELTNNTCILYSEPRFGDGDSIEAVELLTELTVLLVEDGEGFLLLLETRCS